MAGRPCGRAAPFALCSLPLRSASDLLPSPPPPPPHPSTPQQIKNGTPPQRKAALRQITDKARDLGAGPLFNQILPLLMQPTLEDQERHLLVKVIDRCACLRWGRGGR